MPGNGKKNIDFYAMDEAWTLKYNAYPYEAQGDAVEFAQKAFEEVFKK